MTVQNFFFTSQEEYQDLGGGIKRRIMSHNENLMCVEVVFEKGAIGSMHQHPHEQCTVVVDGVFEFTVGDEKKVVRKGDALYKQPDILHGCVCLEAGTLIDIFTPRRNDFL